MPSRETVVARSASALETAEARAARQMAAAYNQARQEILTRLLDGWTVTGVLGPDDAARFLRQSGLLQQVDARLQQLEREVGITLRGIVTAGSERALDSITRELALLPRSIREGFDSTTFGTINERVIEQFVPVAMADWRGLTTSMSSNLQRELQTGLIQGEAYPDLVRRLLSQSPGEGAVFPRAQTSAELATRRLVVAAENGAKQASIAEVSKQIPDIQKQALAAVGFNTTDCCLRVHGQIQPVESPFELVGTPRFADQLMIPPFHHRCRTGIVMYHPAFEKDMPTDKLKAQAQAELKRRREGEQGKARRSDTAAAPTPPPVATVRSPEPLAVEAVAPLPTVPQPEADVIERVEAKLDTAIARIAQHYKTTTAEVEVTVAKAAAELTDPSKPVSLRVSSGAIDTILDSGRFKSQFETGSSGAVLDQELRAKAENRGLGIAIDLPPDQRPIYGYVANPQFDRWLKQYGDLVVEFKPEIRNRTTVLMGDSLTPMNSGEGVPSPLNNLRKSSWDGNITSLYETAKGHEEWGMTGMEYVEVQIHGQAKVSDIARIRDTERALTGAQLQRLRGLSISVIDSDGKELN